MTDSSNPTVQGLGNLASNAAFGTNTDEAKILSYMWYVHVTVRVNAADRLWDRLLQLLEQGIPKLTATATSPASPPYSSQLDLDGINDAGSGSPGRRGNGAGVANEIDDLTDYLVLRHFSGLMLTTLVKTAPVDQHTDGYARVLGGVPAHFRVEFCRRLYCLLFSKYIIEWPPGIAVPDPAPGSIAAAAAAAAAANSTAATASSTGSETAVDDACQIPKEGEDDKKDEFMFDMEEIVTDLVKDDYVLDSESHKCLVSPEPASPGYQSTLGPSSPWPDTPSLGYSPELARAAYFGTVSDPLPIQYLGDCAGRVSRSSSSISRDDGPARAAYAGAAGASAERHDERLPTPSWNNRRHPAQAPEAPPQQQHQQHATNPQECRRPASPLLLRSAHSRDEQQVSHTGSCCPCRGREAWSHGVGGPR